ncbi:MAG: hypothetical protein JWP29_1938 [Rhodoferax sp.]|nr:hypothetical protein [Rhodoferax sp.]
MSIWSRALTRWLDRTEQPADPLPDWDRVCPGSYLVIRRSIAQSMPEDWQREMARLYRQMVQRCETAQVELVPTVVSSRVQGPKGQFQRDPLARFEDERNPFTEGRGQ